MDIREAGSVDRAQDVEGPLTGCAVDDVIGRPIRETLDRVGDKWSVLVIGVLRHGPRRFSDLRRSVSGISQRMLTLTLRQHERDGLVSRTFYPEVPPRVEYELTDLGSTLIPPVLAIANWAVTHHEEMEANRARYDAALTTPAA